MAKPEKIPSEVQDDTIEIGEATLATIGLTNILKGDMPKVGIGLQKEIIGIDKRIDELARGFVADDLPGRFNIPRPFTYRKLLERFTKPISELEMKTIKDKFPADATEGWNSFQSTLQSAYAKLADMLPVSTVDTYLGPKNIKPTSDKEFDFWVLYWVIDNPLIAFKLMQRGAIIPEQVIEIKEFYPSLYNYMKVSTLSALVDRNLKDKKFINLPPRSDRGLATFKQMRIVPYGPNVHVVPPNEPKAAPAEPSKINKGLQTAGQQADNVAV